eukprot:6741429-Ditylum_brightwellii.AAC.1
MSPASVHADHLPHGEEFVSIVDELVAQASHMYPLYHEYNAAVYFCLGDAFRGIQYALTLKPCQSEMARCSTSLRGSLDSTE